MARHFVKYRIRVEKLILAIAAPQRWRHADGCCPIPNPSHPWICEIAQPKISRAANVTMTTRKIFFQRHSVAFFYSPPLCGDPADLRDHANILMAENAGLLLFPQVRRPIAAAYSCSF